MCVKTLDVPDLTFILNLIPNGCHLYHFSDGTVGMRRTEYGTTLDQMAKWQPVLSDEGKEVSFLWPHLLALSDSLLIRSVTHWTMCCHSYSIPADSTLQSHITGMWAD